MASLDSLQKRLENKEKALEKLNKKMERIQKAKASNWENNPYYYNESDERYTQKEINATQEVIEDYKKKIQIIIEKSNSKKVQVIIDFLDDWKVKNFDFYSEGLSKYFDEKQKVDELRTKINNLYWNDPDREKLQDQFDNLSSELYNKLNGKYERKGYRKVRVQFGEYEYIAPFIRTTYKDSIEYLSKELDEEADRKYDFIIERTNDLIGEIIDASNLKINPKGELDGIVTGTRGKAKIQTYGAGGYNIQAFHFRTRIDKIN